LCEPHDATEEVVDIPRPAKAVADFAALTVPFDYAQGKLEAVPFKGLSIFAGCEVVPCQNRGFLTEAAMELELS